MKRVVLVTTRSLLGSTKSIPVTPVATVVISQHAPISEVDAGAEAATGAQADGIVSLGGGSAIDAAKIISVRLAGDEGRALPHIAVPTTLSVAELAAGAGFTDEGGDKAGMRDPRLLVETVVYDAELTMATPLELWLSTGIRALDHAVEGFLSPGEHPFNDVLALEGIRRLFDSLPRAKASPADVAVRTENQLAAWFSFTLPGPSGVMGGDAADRVQQLIESLGLPQHIAERGIGEPQLRIAAEELGGKYPAVDLLEIYKSAL